MIVITGATRNTGSQIGNLLLENDQKVRVIGCSKKRLKPFKDKGAEIVRWLHPLRMSRYGFSDLNPFMWPIKYIAPYVSQNRQPVTPKNSLSSFC